MSYEIDSQGRTLTEAQAEFFKDSKAVDEKGRLRELYHGTVGKFYVYDKSLRGKSTGTEDSKLGFFFTDSEHIAKTYADYAMENKYWEIVKDVTRGDPERYERLIKTEIADNAEDMSNRWRFCI